MLHRDGKGLVELAAGSRRGGRLQIGTRRRSDHFLAGGQDGGKQWLQALLSLAAFHANRGEEVFLAPAVRSTARAEKNAVSESGWLWVDVDQPGQLGALWAFQAERPCHLLIESGGSGGAHAYWKLSKPLPATRLVESTGEVIEPIERANLRIVNALGLDVEGKPNVADPACAERSRVMRLAGTVNGKTGAHARIIQADPRLPPYRIAKLVGDLPDPQKAASPGIRRRRAVGDDPDPYKRIPPPDYFEALAGISVPERGGLVRCPAPWHTDEQASCSVSTEPARGWCCHAGTCRARGAIYDLASVLLGGLWGRELRGEAFKRARAYVADVFGELRNEPQPAKENER
jgi:hypothetical protein